MAKSLMHSVPPLFVAVAYSEKSLRNKTFYDSPTEVYALTTENEAPQGLFVQSMGCYMPTCRNSNPNDCGAYFCPKRVSQLLNQSIVNVCFMCVM